jgi:mannitol-specific phosphotransferase system IIBC component
LNNLNKWLFTNNTTGASILILVKLFSQIQLLNLTLFLKILKKKIQEQKQAEMQQQQQMQTEQLASQEKQKQMEIDASAQKDDKMIQKDITVAEIRAAGYGAMADINENKDI